MTKFQPLNASSRAALGKRIAAIPDHARDAAAKVVQTETDALADEMRRGLPDDDTGALRRSIRAIIDPEADGVLGRVSVGGQTTTKRVRKGVKDRHAEAGEGLYDYALAIEYGHLTPANSTGKKHFSSQRHVPARPFFWPAYRRRKKIFIRRMRAAIKKALATT